MPAVVLVAGDEGVIGRPAGDFLGGVGGGVSAVGGHIGGGEVDQKWMERQARHEGDCNRERGRHEGIEARRREGESRGELGVIVDFVLF
jgi:hypothetical protein